MTQQIGTRAKTLPIVERPIIHGFQFYAYPLAILSNYEQARPWIHSNFLQMCLYKEFLDDFVVPIAPYLFDYSVNPFLRVQRLQRDFLTTFNISILDLVIDSINKGNYLHLNIDEYHLPCRSSYQKHHFVHDILVFGYDEEAQTLDVLGFDQQLLFGAQKISFTEFQDAYESLEHIPNWNTEITLYQFKEDGQYAFRADLAADLLEDYVLSRNTSERLYMLQEPYDRAYGLEIYQHLKTYFRLLIEEKIWLDIKYTHNLWEHKKCVLALIQYMEEQGTLDPALGFYKDYQAIEQRAFMFRNIMFRYSADRNGARLEKLIDMFDAFAADERAVLERLIDRMRGNPA